MAFLEDIMEVEKSQGQEQFAQGMELVVINCWDNRI